MLLGEFNHNIDEKGRLIIPAKLREDLGDSFVICNGLEGCLFVYSQEESLNATFLGVHLRAVSTSRGEFLSHRHLERMHIWRRK